MIIGVVAGTGAAVVGAIAVNVMAGSVSVTGSKTILVTAGAWTVCVIVRGVGVPEMVVVTVKVSIMDDTSVTVTGTVDTGSVAAGCVLTMVTASCASPSTCTTE